MQTKQENGRCRDVHLGKSSYGWSFSFRGYRDDYENQRITSFKEWTSFIEKEIGKGGIIFDEYDDKISLPILLKKIDSKKSGQNHAVYAKDKSETGYSYSHAGRCAVDEEGNSFSYCEFS